MMQKWSMLTSSQMRYSVWRCVGDEWSKVYELIPPNLLRCRHHGQGGFQLSSGRFAEASTGPPTDSRKYHGHESEKRETCK